MEHGAGSSIGVHVVVYGDVVIGDGSRLLDPTDLASGSVVGRACFLGVAVTTTSDDALARLPNAGDRARRGARER